MDRLTLCRPPILQHFENHKPVIYRVPTCHCLYTGWSFWFGRETLHASKLARYPQLRKLSFLEINQLCDFALLQQYAIDATLEAREK